MKERPILFSATMVRAILDGRKTMTRRVVKPQPFAGKTADQVYAMFRADGTLLPDESLSALVNRAWQDGDINVRCPYGQPGDRLWVREAFAIVPRTAYARSEGVQQTLRPDDPYEHDAAIYREGWDRSTGGFRWRPSIHMPRWASRITLEITAVRVERLNDISPDDAIAEGLRGITKDGKLVKYGIPDKDGLPGTDDTGWPWHEWRISPVDAYQKLWESINGPGSWALNPWVWVVVFKRI